jgi:hypothetical protein
MRRCLGAIGAVSLVLFLLAAPAAMARSENGNPCTANDSAAGWTVIGLNNPPNADVFMQPTVWSGLITRWKVQVGAGMAPLAQQLVVFEQVFVGDETQYRKVGESAVETVMPGSNEFATRIPLSGEKHHYVGLHGPLETLFCDKQELAGSGVVSGDFPLGESRSVEYEGGMGTPVTVIAETDSDGDGFGDEGQDGCPRSAATQGECPTVTPSARAKLDADSIVLSVRTDSEGLVKVAGQTSWRLHPKRRGRAGAKRSRKTGGRFVAHLEATEEKTVLPGAAATFTVPLPRSVKRQLNTMKPGQSLKARITATATDLAYRDTAAAVTVKLPGRKPAHRKR